MCRIGLKESFCEVVLLVLTKNEPSVVDFLVDHVQLHHAVVINKSDPVVPGVGECTVGTQLALLSKLNKANKLLNVVVKKGAILTSVLNIEAKHLLLVLFDDKKVDLRL
jgi:hypothetical protein